VVFTRFFPIILHSFSSQFFNVICLSQVIYGVSITIVNPAVGESHFKESIKYVCVHLRLKDTVEHINVPCHMKGLMQV